VVDYRELTTEPRATVHKIYHALAMTLTENFDHFLQAQEEKEKSHSMEFHYSIEDYELSREEIESNLSDFYDAYSWPRGGIVSQATQSSGS
jgi:hypothetical protein